MNKTIVPVGKYINSDGSEGIRYIWQVDGRTDYYVESGSFLRRTKLGIGTNDEQIRAYTTSVSLGCILSQNGSQCKFCVTGNQIPFVRRLTSREIAFQNIYMVLDDFDGNVSKYKREFAYMGQGEPGFSYNQIKEAIIGTDIIINKLGYKTHRHIFATSGVPQAILSLTDDCKNGVYAGTKILLHLSVNSVNNRSKLMPINNQYPLEKVIKASEEYSIATKEKVVVNFLMFKNSKLCDIESFTNITKGEISNLTKLFNPKYHRIILCEYNPNKQIGKNDMILINEVDEIENQITSKGFEVKRFISFGREDKLACGLLGGKASPNLKKSAENDEKIKKAMEFINKYVVDR